MTVKKLIQLLLEYPMSTPVKLSLSKELVAPLAFVERDQGAHPGWITLEGWDLEKVEDKKGTQTTSCEREERG